jgi:hypothetical protein
VNDLVRIVGVTSWIGFWTWDMRHMMRRGFESRSTAFICGNLTLYTTIAVFPAVAFGWMWGR